MRKSNIAEYRFRNKFEIPKLPLAIRLNVDIQKSLKKVLTHIAQCANVVSSNNARAKSPVE